MLTSLFGDLGGARGPTTPGAAPDPSFAATAIMESVATEVNARGQMVDRHSADLVVTGSPAQAIREHFAATRGDLDSATALITLLDPAGVWASAVIKALSDAGGRPIERLHLRETGTLRTLATIERTTLARRHEEAMRIYHADVRAPGSENAAIPVALMERSQMTTVIIGPLQPHAIDALLGGLQAASMLPTWRCPHLLFMLPPNAVWIGNKIGAITWPGRLHVHVLSESLTGASAVWNALLGMWNEVKTESGWGGDGEAASTQTDLFPNRTAEFAAEYPAAPPSIAGLAPAWRPPARPGFDAGRARAALAGLLTLDGLIGCAVVDASSGRVIASEARDDPPLDIDHAAAACAPVLRAHREAARAMGLDEPLDELMTTAGHRQQVMRAVSRHPELFLVALLDRRPTNLALARLHLQEVDRSLA